MIVIAKRSTTETCCLTLPLKPEKWQADKLSKRFEIAGQLYNTLLRAELKKLKKLEQSPEYRKIQSKLRELYLNNEKDSKEYSRLSKQRSKLIKNFDFSEFQFKRDMGAYYKYFNQNIKSSVAIHCIASQVWIAFEKKLFKNGKYIHFKRPGDIRSLKGYSSKKSGGIEIIFRGTYIEWNKIKIPLKLNPNNQYESEMLSRHIKYVRILRTPGKNKDHWYAQLMLEGTPAIKLNAKTGEPIHPTKKGKVGIDIGPQTIAYVSKNAVELKELADRVQNIEHQKLLIQRKMDRSRRSTNPENYALNGTIKRGVKLTRNKSKRYLKLQKELAFIQHKQAVIRKEQHTQLANHLLSLGDCFYIEKMEWSKLTKRAKNTEISEKTGRYKRKKRFGKSVANKAPAMFVNILKQKCVSLRLPGVIEVPTKIKASQYNHITDSYQKKELSERWNFMPDGKRIQRDIYSAFLLQHVSDNLSEFDRHGLIIDYDDFVVLHDKAIDKLSHSSKTISSMGIKRTLS